MVVALRLTLLSLLVVLVNSSGWLDQVVQYHKQKFIQDLKDTLPTVNDQSNKESPKAVDGQIQGGAPEVSLHPLPAGFEDHPEWDVESVSRLLDVLRASQSGRRVLRALRRSMPPTRRWMMSKQLSYKLFPSINKDDFYLDSDEESPEYPDYPHYPQMMSNFNDNTLVVVANPVESRLPSGHISVAMLRRILEQRAEAARIMPNTTVVTMTWLFTGSTKKGAQNTSTPTPAANDTNGVNGSQPNNSSADAGPGQNNTDAGPRQNNTDAGPGQNNTDGGPGKNNGSTDVTTSNDTSTPPGSEATSSGSEATSPSSEATTPSSEATSQSEASSASEKTNDDKVVGTCIESDSECIKGVFTKIMAVIKDGDTANSVAAIADPLQITDPITVTLADGITGTIPTVSVKGFEALQVADVKYDAATKLFTVTGSAAMDVSVAAMTVAGGAKEETMDYVFKATVTGTATFSIAADGLHISFDEASITPTDVKDITSPTIDSAKETELEADEKLKDIFKAKLEDTTKEVAKEIFKAGYKTAMIPLKTYLAAVPKADLK